MADEHNGNGDHERVTMRTLNSKLEVQVANNRAEHWKTRLLVVGLTLASNSKALPVLFGYLGVHVRGWHLPW